MCNVNKPTEGCCNMRADVPLECVVCGKPLECYNKAILAAVPVAICPKGTDQRHRDYFEYEE